MNNDWLDTIAFKFAEEAGTIAMTTRDMDELKKLYVQFATDVQAEIQQLVLQGKIEELEALPVNRPKVGIPGVSEVYLVSQIATLESQLEELEDD
jgi:hypothetical protein